MNTARFWAKVVVDGECWLWSKAVNSKGYGCFAIRSKSYLAHRLSYELAYGPIPDGLVIDHVVERGCTSRRCVRPDHLDAVTTAENNRRSRAVRWPKSLPQAPGLTASALSDMTARMFQEAGAA